MKTLGLSKMGLNGVEFYKHLLNNTINLGEEIKVETVEFKSSYDFILFDGGSDVSPSLYSEKKHPTTYNNELRDMYEQNIFLKYKNTPTKFLGICRGSQFLNVMMGGNLYQNLADYNKQHWEYHDIEIILPINKIIPQVTAVNSTHHQAVKNLGKGLIPVAVELYTRIIEMYIDTKDKIRATQFHPEFYNTFPYTKEFIKWLLRYD